jgi:hypothetical protein
MRFNVLFYFVISSNSLETLFSRLCLLVNMSGQSECRCIINSISISSSSKWNLVYSVVGIGGVIELFEFSLYRSSVSCVLETFVVVFVPDLDTPNGSFCCVAFVLASPPEFIPVTSRTNVSPLFSVVLLLQLFLLSLTFSHVLPPSVSRLLRMFCPKQCQCVKYCIRGHWTNLCYELHANLPI